jgi:MFS family permease
VASSALCAAAQDITQLIALRVVQGAAAGGLMTLAMAAVGDLVPPRERGRYQGYIAATFAVATIVGPLLGGLIVEHASWRWVFVVNLPVGAVALAGLAARLPAPETERPDRPLDVAGAILLTGATSALLLTCIWGGERYAWGSGPIVGLIVATLVLSTALLVRERRAADPIVPFHLLRTRVVAVASSTLFLATASLFAITVFVPLFLQATTDATPTEAGLLLVPAMLGITVSSTVSGRLIVRTGRYKVFPVAGSLVMEVPLRDTAKAGAGDVGGGFGMPERAESLEQLELAIARLLRSGGPSAMAEIREESGTRLDVGDGWCVGAVYLRARLGRDADVTEIAHRYRLPGAVLRPAFEHARAAGYLTGDDDQLRLTETGQQEIDGLIAAMFAWLSRELRDWDIEDDQLLRDAMGNIARQIVEQDPFPAPTPELTAAAAR